MFIWMFYLNFNLLQFSWSIFTGTVRKRLYIALKMLDIVMGISSRNLVLLVVRLTYFKRHSFKSHASEMYLSFQRSKRSIFFILLTHINFRMTDLNFST